MPTIHYAGWSARAGAPTTVELAERAAVVATLDRGPKRHTTRDAPPAIDRRDPAIGKWALLVRAEDMEPAREAFAPLIEHRRQQGVAFEPPAGRPGATGILPVDAPPPELTATRWLRRIQEAVGSTLRTPHYLLLVGGPERIPFEAQRVIGERFSVGRIDVGDDPVGPLSWQACRRYAEKVVAYETGRLPIERRALLYAFATDAATRMSYEGLAMPLEARLETLGVPLDALLHEQATTHNLLAALGRGSPALVVTLSHGLEMCDEPELWGALTDSTFSGRAGGTPFSARVVPETALARGAIVLAFACYSAGVPQRSAHRLLTHEGDEDLPGGARTAALPRRLLAHPQGPVAFVGHVDRTTALSFRQEHGRPPAEAFEHFVGWTFDPAGTLGRAISSLGEEARRAASRLAGLISPTQSRTDRAARAEHELLAAWLAYHDLSDHVLLGDPVIRPGLALASQPSRSEAG